MKQSAPNSAAREPVKDDKFEWINPIGGLGDMLMLSGVLQQVLERDATRRFRLVRRTGYMSLIEGHPAVLGQGFARQTDTVIGMDYWSHPGFERGGVRAMTALGRAFGLDGEIEERFCISLDDNDDSIADEIPWRDINILIAPASESPRKEWAHRNWETVVRELRGRGFFVIQTGLARNRYVAGAYSLLGTTSPKQTLALARRADVVITVDNFLMHAAHHWHTNAVVLWGPTSHLVYGYPEQTHLRPDEDCPDLPACVGPGRGHLYAKPCPKLDSHCVDRIQPGQVLAAVDDALARRRSSTPSPQP
jgi:hypothetical protein